MDFTVLSAAMGSITSLEVNDSVNETTESSCSRRAAGVIASSITFEFKLCHNNSL